MGWIRAAFVTLMAFALAAPAAALPDPGPLPAPRPVARAEQPSAEGARAYVTWIQTMTALVAHASQASTALGSFDGSLTTREAVLASLPQMRAVIAQARQILRDASTELDAVQPLAAPGLTQAMQELADSQLRDARTYITNMSELTDASSDMLDGIEANDAPLIQRAVTRLNRSAVVLIQGQRTILRGRQQLLASTQSEYHIMGAMTAMYNGMEALLEDDQAMRRTRLSAAADAADRWSVSGRVALAGERSNIIRYRPADRPALNDLMAVSEEAFALNDRVSVFLRQCAASDANANLSSQQMRQIASLEEEYQRLAQRQVAMAARLAQTH